MTALRPGQSPPPVRTPMRAMAGLFHSGAALRDGAPVDGRAEHDPGLGVERPAGPAAAFVAGALAASAAWHASLATTAGTAGRRLGPARRPALDRDARGGARARLRRAPGADLTSASRSVGVRRAYAGCASVRAPTRPSQPWRRAHTAPTVQAWTWLANRIRRGPSSSTA